MARPKTIKLPGGGEIILKNVDAALVKSLEETIAGASAPDRSNTIVSLAAVEAEEPNYIGKAVGTYHKKNKWAVVVLEFDPNTHQSRITDTLACEDKSECIERFKITVVENELI
jgi:hypothetical protein